MPSRIPDDINGDAEHGSAVEFRRCEIRDVVSGACKRIERADFLG